MRLHRDDWRSRTHYVIEDPVTGASYDLTDGAYTDGNGKIARVRRGTVQWATSPANPSVAIAIDALRRRTGSKVHWIGLTDSQSRTVPCMGGFVASEDGNWGRDGYIRGTAPAWDTAVIAAACRFSGSRSNYMDKALDRADDKIEKAKTNRSLITAIAEKQAMANSVRSLATIIGEFLAV